MVFNPLAKIKCRSKNRQMSEFEANQVYTVNSNPDRAIHLVIPCLQKTKIK